MKKAILFLIINFQIGNLLAQSSTTDNLDFARDFVSCHHIINDALNYNTQPLILSAFFKEAEHHLQSAESLFNKNKEAWSVKIAPHTIEDVELLFTQYKQFITKSKGLSEQELKSATLWLRIARTRNIEVTQKILAK